MAIRLTLVGATGRMGKMIRQVVQEDEEISINNLCVYYGHPNLGAMQEAEQVSLSAFDLDRCINTDVVVDFSLSEAMKHNVETAMKCSCPIVLGATGLQQEQIETLHKHSKNIPIFWSPNTSIGVAVLRNLVQKAAQILPDEYDIEILEMHHRHKLDSPSGTALDLGKSAATGRQKNADSVSVHAQHETGKERQVGSIGYSSLRGGGIVGDHEVSFTNEFEQVGLRHRALDRRLFAIGALRAARWLVSQPPGLYGMDDMVSNLIK